MKRGLVLVEGQTEERFVTECLAPYFLDRGLGLTPKILTTKRVVGAPNHKGGIRSFEQVQRDLHLLCGDSHASLITTVIDYYALPDDFPSMANRPTSTPRARVEHVERVWA